MKNRTKWSLFIGFLIVTLSFILRSQEIISTIPHLLLLNMGFIVIYSVNWPRDERSKRISAKSMACSWYVTFFVVLILLMYIGLKPAVLEVHTVLFIIFWTMLVSAAICYRWLYHTGKDKWESRIREFSARYNLPLASWRSVRYKNISLVCNKLVADKVGIRDMVFIVLFTSGFPSEISV